MNNKCSRKGCEEEGRFYAGFGRKARLLCTKHYAMHLRKKSNTAERRFNKNGNNL